MFCRFHFSLNDKFHCFIKITLVQLQNHPARQKFLAQRTKKVGCRANIRIHKAITFPCYEVRPTLNVAEYNLKANAIIVIAFATLFLRKHLPEQQTNLLKAVGIAFCASKFDHLIFE